jgi:hypothetical protein
VETNGISLNPKQEETKNDRPMLKGVLWGLGVAAALGLAFMLGGRGNSGGDGASAQTGIVEQVAGSDGGGPNAPGGANDSGDIVDEPMDVSEQGDEPVDEPEQPVDEFTETPTATATPDYECAVCPDDVDGFAAEPTPTPVDPCPLCPDEIGGFAAAATPFVICPQCLNPQLDADVPDLAFEKTVVNFCEEFVGLKAEITGNAEIWVTYEKEWQVLTESEHQFGESFAFVETATWGWFGGWGWIYPYDFTFHAEDAEGNYIKKSVQPNYVC